MKRTPLKRSTKPLSKGRGFAASPQQRAKVKDEVCLVCGQGPVDPAHLIARARGGGDDPREVIALCRAHHRAYDLRELSLLEYEHLFPEESAYAVLNHGIVQVVKRLANNARIVF